MKKEGFCSTLLPLVIITIGGLFALGMCYLLFVLINNFFEFRLFSANPSEVPVFIIRRVLAQLLLVLYVVLFRTKISDIVKSTILVGPMGFFFSTAILTLYQKPVWAIVIIVLITAVSIFLLSRSKKPWFYYYAVAIALLVSIALAWPRA